MKTNITLDGVFKTMCYIGIAVLLQFTTFQPLLKMTNLKYDADGKTKGNLGPGGGS